MPVLIRESGVFFGSFPDEDCFRIENSPACKALGEGVKLAEFVLMRKELSLWIVEAKSSIPRYPAKDDEEYDKKLDNYEQFFEAIEEKLLNSLTLILMSNLGRQSEIQIELPPGLQDLQWECLDVFLLLVIPDAPKEPCISLTDKLCKKLSRTMKMWNIAQSNVQVVNEEIARGMKLIQ